MKSTIDRLYIVLEEDVRVKDYNETRKWEWRLGIEEGILRMNE
jgi:hypothetical protein